MPHDPCADDGNNLALCLLCSHLDEYADPPYCDLYDRDLEASDETYPQPERCEECVEDFPDGVVP